MRGVEWCCVVSRDYGWIWILEFGCEVENEGDASSSRSRQHVKNLA